MKYVWAAYKRGVFNHLEEFKAELDPFEFRSVFLSVIGNKVLGVGGEVWVFEDEVPVGLVMATPGGENHIEPHSFWFPESSPRNRLEFSLRWLVDMKENFKIDIWSREADWKFFRHLCKYGVIRPVGKRRGFYADGEDAMYFQEVN